MNKVSLTLLAIAVFAAVSLPAAAQSAAAGGKIGSVDMKKLFADYWKTKQSQTVIDAEIAKKRKELKDMADDLDKAKADYKKILDQSNDPLISAEEREKRKATAADKARQINTSQAAFESYQRQEDSRLKDQQQRMTAKLVADIQKAVVDKAKAGGYSAIVNSGTTEVVLYADPANDLTDAVLKQLNAGAPPETIKPATGLPLNISTNIP